jgi:hypothetical protein
MEPLTSFNVLVEIFNSSGEALYSGEAIYRPKKAHPVSQDRVPMFGVPDASMLIRPAPSETYQVRVKNEEIAVDAVYLERVSTCWWFVLEHPSAQLPSA